MNPINNQLSHLECLPADALGNVLDQLNRATGSKGIINKSDIPVIMRYVSNLACTSKSMATNINHLNVVHLFLKSLSDKYGQSLEHFAAVINTNGARKWIWNYIIMKGDDKNYQIIQNVYELASNALKEANEAGLDFKYTVEHQEEGPNAFHDQTRQGFALYIYEKPSHLATPFGKIQIYRSGSFSGCSKLSVSEFFIKRLNAILEVNYRKKLEENSGEIFEIVSLSDSPNIREISKEEIKKINKDELKTRNATQNLIGNSNFESTYQIREAGMEKVPELVWYDSQDSMRSYKLINIIWEMLEAKRLGTDPIAKKSKAQNEIFKSTTTKEVLFNNILEISQWGFDLVVKLEQQPLYPEKTWVNKPTKLLALDNPVEAKSIELLNSSAKKFLTEDSNWLIHFFGDGENLRSLNGKALGYGIELWIYENRKPCEINALKAAYETVMKNISQNWTEAKLKDYPAILHTESEEDYILFVKKEKSVLIEDSLISFLADLLGLAESIHCKSDWIDKNSSGLYMWIKKDALEKTLKAFNINFE